MTDNAPEIPQKEVPRIFLVVVDDTEEWRAALRYACRRAQHTGGRVALLHVITPSEIQHWGAIEDVLREEARHEAEQRLQRVAREVNQLTGTIPILHIREGAARDELLALIAEEPSISVLVLGADTVSSSGPGPLIQYLTSSRAIARLRIPLTIVPGNLTTEAIDALT
jgi:nucleotide-binding universal stress UspA family protein